MNLIQRRIKGLIARLGDTFTSGGVSGKALVSVLSIADAQTYLTAAELGAAAMPVRALFCPYDDATATAATVAWNGLTLTVKRVVEVRSQDATLLRMLVAV